ncbi:lasso peptide biosynthesis B2 protein [Streptacidiphilus fuscans]|nr:lasso peptide biosynthesis B2 protein [Streptacidiphilus fuscans]
MSVQMSLDHREALPLWRRPAPLLAVGAARVLARVKPATLRKVLEFTRRGADAATTDQAAAAREQVVAVSARCAGNNCLQRSIASALLCRVRGTWPTWCTGVRTHPFAAHAWIQVDGEPIGEPHPAGFFHPLLAVEPKR